MDYVPWHRAACILMQNGIYSKSIFLQRFERNEWRSSCRHSRYFARLALVSSSLRESTLVCCESRWTLTWELWLDSSRGFHFAQWANRRERQIFSNFCWCQTSTCSRAHLCDRSIMFVCHHIITNCRVKYNFCLHNQYSNGVNILFKIIQLWMCFLSWIKCYLLL